MERRRFLAGSALAAFGGTFGPVPLELITPRGTALAAGGGDQPKPPTDFTKAENAKYTHLPYGEDTDFKDAARGFIAHLPDNKIMNDGRVFFDAKPFEIPVEEPTPDTMNPSLWRICKLNGYSGLFKVDDGLYQVRSIDIANMTIMECGKNGDGLIVIDCTQTAIAANAALELYWQHVDKDRRRKVKAVIFTHSHVDHYGGVAGVTNIDDVKAGRVRIIAPQNFTDEAVSENLYAGNAMYRRATYMYGTGLKFPPGAHVRPIGPGAVQTLGSGLGVLGGDQGPSLFTPQREQDWVTPTHLKMNIEDVAFEFLLVPGSEAPSEMHFFNPDKKWLCTAENAVHTLHNFYTLRGAKTRDISKWVKYLNETLDKWGKDAKVLYAPHHWPIWDNGKGEIVAHIENYRDAFKYIHDRSLHLANSGYSLPQLGDMVKLPKALAVHWATRGYYGTVSHNARAVYNFYLGYFGGNPADLHPLPPPEAAPRYVELMGGAPTVIKRAQEAYDKGEYRWVAQLLEHVVYADPKNQEARNLQADAFEQLGYQAEAATWRNFYFVGAKELRHGVPDLPVEVMNPEYLAPNITLALTCEYVGIAVDSDRACDKVIAINCKAVNERDASVIEEERSLVLKNQVVNSRDSLLDTCDVELTATRDELNKVLLSGDVARAREALKNGDIKAKGNEQALLDLIGMMVKFPFWFPIVTPAARGDQAPACKST